MVQLQPRGTQFDALEPGVYPFVVDSVTAEDANDRFDDPKPQLKFIFKIPDPEGGEDRLVFDWTGQTYGPRSKLRPWLAVLLPDFDPDVDALETDDLIGRRGRAMLSTKASGYNRVAEVLPLRPVKKAPAPAPAESRTTPDAFPSAEVDLLEPEAVTF